MTRMDTFNNQPEAGPSRQEQPRTHTRKEKGKNRAPPRFQFPNIGKSEDDSSYENESSHGRSSWMDHSPPSSPEPQRMAAPPPPVSFSAPLRTTYDMPIRGHKDAPRTFRGKHTEVQRFIDHYEQLLNKCRVTSEREKCDMILNYCSVDVQNVIQTMDYFDQGRWPQLKREILKQFDAERAVQKYKPVDVERYAVRKRGQSCHSLTQWRRYYVKYNAIAGGPLRRGHLSRADYLEYFWIGIPRPLRPLLENRIRQTNPYRGDDQYTVKELNDAAEWYFRRNKYETLMIRAADLGEDLDDDDSDEDSGSETSGSDADESDFEEFRKKRKEREKRKKEEKKKKVSSRRDVKEKGRQTMHANEEEVAGMIRKLNSMRLDDPEYAPIYYKVMVMDQSGNAGKCVQPPVTERTEIPRHKSVPSRVPTPTVEKRSSPASYPNNIPLGTGRGTGVSENKGCFGCGQEGHRMFECQGVNDLVAREVIRYDEGVRRMVMKDGNPIRRRFGESLVQAAERLAIGGAPRVMLVQADWSSSRQAAVRNFYQEQSQHAHIEEIDSEGSLDRDSSVMLTDTENDEKNTSEEYEEIYLTLPKRRKTGPPLVQQVDRTVPSMKTARRQVMDGVYPPSRAQARARTEVKEIGKSAGKDAAPPTPPLSRSADPPQATSFPDAGKSQAKVREFGRAGPLPEITPVEARKVRFDKTEDAEMKEAPKDKPGIRSLGKDSSRNEQAASKEDDSAVSKSTGRQSELTATVDKQGLMDRILNTQISMSLREIMVTSREIRSEFQDLIKLKNIKAVLLGRAQNHPLIASFGWPRVSSDGVLIKVEMETAGNLVSAIIDTGSQLNVVRTDVAALVVRRAVDMNHSTNMSDANGGRGKLQGRIDNVEFNCGGAVTVTDLWLSQQAPFELLLGRPWQRGNRVSIDERDEGTYLIFKDRETRRPRYELLAVPYESAPTEFPVGHVAQYESFTILEDSRVSIDEDFRRRGRMEAQRSAENGNGPESKMEINKLSSFLEDGDQLQDKENESGLYLAAVDNIMAQGAAPDRAALGTAVFSQHRHLEVVSQIAPERIRRGSEDPKGRRALSDSQPTMSSPMLSIDISNPARRRLVIDDGARFDGFAPQYLSRRRYHEPHVPDLTLNTTDPIAIIEDGVERFWKNRDDGQIACAPAFSAAPQSEYLGVEVLPSGQRVHRSAFYNSFEVMKNLETGRPYAVMGHAIRILLEAPSDPQVPWAYELPYPTNAAIRNEMMKMSPHDPPRLGEVGFPTHATRHTPVFMNDAERADAYLVSKIDPTAFTLAYAEQATAGLMRPSELQRRYSDQSSNESPPSSDTVETVSSAVTSSHATTLVEALVADVTQRAKDVLDAHLLEKFGGETVLLVESTRIPSLDEYSDERGKSVPIAVGICSVCFELEDGQHNCQGPAGSEEDIVAPSSRFAATQPTRTTPGRPNEDCILLGVELIPLVLGERRTEYLQDILQTALTPTLDALISMPAAKAAKYLRLVDAARTVRQSFEELAAQIDADDVSGEESAIEQLAREIEAALERTDDPSTATAAAPLPLTSRADELLVPAFNAQRGQLVDRSSWSSSSVPSLTSTSSGDLELVPFHVVADPPLPHRPHAPVTEWSVTSSILQTDPQEVIDAAVRRVPAGRWSGDLFSTSGHHSRPDYVNIVPDSGSNGFRATDAAAPPFQVQFGSIPAPQRETLRQWMRNGQEHQLEHNLNENFIDGQPIRHAFEVLHGHLHEYIDYPAMAAKGLERLRVLSAVSVGLRPLPLIPPTPPNFSQSPTSLDFSLPTPPTEPSATTAPPVIIDTTISVAGVVKTNPDVREDNGNKRKSPDDERAGQTQEGPRKRFRKFQGDLLRRMVLKRAAFQAAIHTISPIVVQYFAGIRLAFMEGLRLIEGMAWHRYGIDEVRGYYVAAERFRTHQQRNHRAQEDFPMGFNHHPLLTDVEVAKYHAVYSVLHKQERYEMAGLLFDVLSLRLRPDYALAHLISPRNLDPQYPSAYTQYWELLPYPANTHFHESDTESLDDSFGSEMDAELEYPESNHSETVDRYPDPSASPDEADEEISMHAGDDDLLYLRRVEDWAAETSQALQT
jgi:hypothetical protein